MSSNNNANSNTNPNTNLNTNLAVTMASAAGDGDDLTRRHREAFNRIVFGMDVDGNFLDPEQSRSRTKSNELTDKERKQNIDTIRNWRQVDKVAEAAHHKANPKGHKLILKCKVELIELATGEAEWQLLQIKLTKRKVEQSCCRCPKCSMPLTMNMMWEIIPELDQTGMLAVPPLPTSQRIK